MIRPERAPGKKPNPWKGQRYTPTTSVSKPVGVFPSTIHLKRVTGSVASGLGHQNGERLYIFMPPMFDHV